MPRTGRPPLPTALKLAKGERRPSRVNYDEPKLPVARGTDPPAGLEGAGLREWLRTASTLVDAGVLKDPDLPAFERYCRRVSDLAVAEADLKRMTAIVDKFEKDKAVEPATLIKAWATLDAAGRRVERLTALVNMLARECGLTPSSRTAVKVPPKKDAESPKDRAARYMSAIRGGRA